MEVCAGPPVATPHHEIACLGIDTDCGHKFALHRLIGEGQTNAHSHGKNRKSAEWAIMASSHITRWLGQRLMVRQASVGLTLALVAS